MEHAMAQAQAAPSPAAQATQQNFGPLRPTPNTVQPAQPPQPQAQTATRPAAPTPATPPPVRPTSNHASARLSNHASARLSNQPPTPVGPIHKPADYDDYYDVLAVLPDSSEAEIKAAYRSLIKLWHTDVCKAHDAQDQMNAITEAYEVLSDPDQRLLYDEGLALEEQQP